MLGQFYGFLRFSMFSYVFSVFLRFSTFFFVFLRFVTYFLRFFLRLCNVFSACLQNRRKDKRSGPSFFSCFSPFFRILEIISDPAQSAAARFRKKIGRSIRNFIRFSTFFSFFRDSTALFLRFSRFLETVQHFFLFFLRFFRILEIISDPAQSAAARESCSAKQEAIQTEIALLWPTRRSRRQPGESWPDPPGVVRGPFF